VPRSDVEDRLREKEQETERIANGTLKWAKIAGWMAIVTAVIGIAAILVSGRQVKPDRTLQTQNPLGSMLRRFCFARALAVPTTHAMPEAAPSEVGETHPVAETMILGAHAMPQAVAEAVVVTVVQLIGIATVIVHPCRSAVVSWIVDITGLGSSRLRSSERSQPNAGNQQ
jgi:hypothetical protein